MNKEHSVTNVLSGLFVFFIISDGPLTNTDCNRIDN